MVCCLVQVDHVFYSEEQHRMDYKKKRIFDAVYIKDDSDEIVP